ncbi:MAG: hypothetical protein IKG61_01390 [Selenomonadaceae bacterium]|nr:hypothetical protein [Selenomonadaceae bacterium]
MAHSQERIDNLYNQLSEELDKEIYDFAEEAVNQDYSDNRVNAYWQQRLQNLAFDQKYQNLLQSMAGECERKRKELSDELTQELSYTFNGNTSTNISLEGTTPWGKYAALVLPNLLLFVPGIGWAARLAIGVGSFIFSSLFEDKQEKIREAKAKLSDAITPPSRDILNQMHNKVVETFNNEILAKGVDEFSDLLAGYQFMLAHLGKSQYKIARALFREFKDLNFKLLGEAINYKHAGVAEEVSNIARIPGEIMIIFAERWSLKAKELSDLLGEKILAKKPEEKLTDTVRKFLGCNTNHNFYLLDFGEKPENAVAVFPKNKVNATALKIAQQVAGVPIIQRGD